MDAHELLSNTWRNLAIRRNWETASSPAVLAELLEAYSERGRQYHTIEHVASLLRQLDEHGPTVIDRDAVILAILFHDVIYDPRRHDNEEQSAARAHATLAGLGLPDEVVEKVERYILATKHNPVFVTDDCDLALLLDLDLSILAAPPAEYLIYSEAIRREYGHVPDEQYREGRLQILVAFLTRDRIYRTDRLHSLWEEPARANINKELTGLAAE
jgi:predicted metal-dependent HD superfamily phosphohydrolase